MDIASPPTTFAALWAQRCAETPENDFLLFRDRQGDVSRWTYGEFDEQVAVWRSVLRANGVRQGDPVHIALKNSPAFIALWLAAATMGAWIVPVDPASTQRDFDQQFDRIRPVLGFCAASREQPYLASAVARGVPCIALSETAADFDEPARSLSPGDEPPPGLAPSDRLAVMFTSGTTSRPKGVVLTQANYLEVATAMSAVIDLQPRHRWYVTLPLFHANAQYYCFAPAISVGASVALVDSFSASRWVQCAHELEVTHASLFAAPMRMILARTPGTAPALRLEHVWFAQSLGAEHHSRFAEIAGVRPRQLYGMTETVAIVTADDSPEARCDVIGRPALGRRVRLVDQATGETAAPGAPGEIRVAGVRGESLFSEYLDDPATTARAFSVDDEGVTWLATGDLAVEHEPGGPLSFVGRADDVIKVSGENVSLSEVEAVVAQAPGVLEAAVVSKDDPVRDKVPVAYFVAKDPANAPSADELGEWAAENLAPAARPREWHRIDELPRTSVGKVRRFIMTEAAAEG